MDRRPLWRIALPVALILLGVALLCNNLGIVPGLWSFLIGLWPIALIGLGVLLLFGARTGLPWRRALSQPFSHPLEQVRAATLDLAGCSGVLALEAGSAHSLDLLSGKMPPSAQLEVLTVDGTARAHIHASRAAAWWAWVSAAANWEVRLHPAVRWTVQIGGGPGEAVLDLSDLSVAGLRLDGRGGEAKIKLPHQGSCRVEIGGRLDNLTLRVPPGVAARVRLPAGLSSAAKVDTTRFSLQGDVYQSPDFETDPSRVEIELSGSVGELRVL